MKNCNNDIEKEDNLNFDDIFGAFQAASAQEDDKPMSKIAVIEEKYAQPCFRCGEQPAVHTVNFKDKNAHPKNVYICCSHCSSCDGEWYMDKETALAAWNERNLGAAPRNRNIEDIYDFTARIMENVKFSE